MTDFAEGRSGDGGKAVFASMRAVDDMLRGIADASENTFGIKPDEMGMRVLGAMFAGQPLAPLLNINANQIDGTFEIARAKMKGGDLHGAVSLLRILVTIDFFNKRHWMTLALCLRKLGLLVGAGDSYCIAHVIDRTDLWPVVRAVECYLAADDLANASELVEILATLCETARSDDDANTVDLVAAADKLTSQVAERCAEAAASGVAD